MNCTSWTPHIKDPRFDYYARDGFLYRVSKKRRTKVEILGADGKWHVTGNGYKAQTNGKLIEAGKEGE